MKAIAIEPPPTLDKLAELTHNPERSLEKKAKRKALTSLVALKLASLKNGNEKAYWNMYHCNSLLLQDGQELKTTYCKSRFCSVCNAIKTANLINGYLPELEKFVQPYFVTLTIKAVKARQLRPAIDRMQKDFRSILQHCVKYDKLKIKGIRKLECNYNAPMDTYNPHYHVVVNSKFEAEILLKAWLKKNGRSKIQAQDIRPADQNTLIELFKYATKIVTNGKINIVGMDNIFTALRRKRVIQPIGIKKFVDEDERESVIYVELANETATWSWEFENYNWYNTETGEALTEFVPDNELKLLYEQLKE